MDHFFYELDECVRLDNIDGLYVITARKGRTEHNKKEKYYQIKGTATGKRLLTQGMSCWWKEDKLKKSYSESYMTFHELMDVLKNDVIQQDDFE